MPSDLDTTLGPRGEVPACFTPSPVLPSKARPEILLSPATQLKRCEKPPVPPKGLVSGQKEGRGSKSKKEGSLDAKPGWFRRKLASVLYPDAKQVNLEDTSAKMEAYYDKSRQCWVFPDADGSTPKAQEAGPPPGPPKKLPSPLAHPSDMETVDDSLDAMMAPPRRSSSTPSMSPSPLAAMMAPPPMRSMPISASRGSNNAMTVRAPKPSQSVPTFATFTMKPTRT